MYTCRILTSVLILAALLGVLSGCRQIDSNQGATPTAVELLATGVSKGPPTASAQTPVRHTPTLPVSTASPLPTEPLATLPPDQGLRTASSHTFIRAYGLDDQLFGTAVVGAGEAGDVYVAGYRDNTQAPVVLLRLSADGSIVWQRTYSSAQDFVTTAGYLHDSGWNAPLAAYPWVALSTARDGGVLLAVGDRAIRVAPNGDVLWSWRYGGWLPDQRLEITSVVEHPQGGFYLLAANAISPSPQGSRIGLDDDDLVLVHVDGNGTVMWANEYPSFFADRRSDLRLAGGSDLILGARASAPNGLVVGMVAHLDLEGTVVWARTVDTGLTGDEEYDRAGLGSVTGFQSLGIVSSNSGYQIMLCLGQNLRAVTHKGGEAILVAWLSPAGDLLNARLAHSSTADGFNQALAVESMPDGGVLLSGKTTEFARPRGIMNHNALLMRLDGGGGWQWVRSIGRIQRSVSNNEHSDETASDLYVDADGSIWLAGTSNAFSLEVPWYERPQEEHFDLFVAHLDSFGGATEGGELVHGADFFPPTVRVNPMPGGGGGFRPNLTVTVAVSSHAVTYQGELIRLVQRDLSIAGNGTGEDDPLVPVLTVADGLPRLISQGPFVEVFDEELDLDDDGIPHAWEVAAMELVNPIIVTDEEEKWLGVRDRYPMLNFVNVAPYPSRDDPTHVLFYFCTAWPKDWGADVANLEEHRGDSERIVMAWRILDRRTLELEWVFTSAHKAPTLHEGVWSARHLTCNRGTSANVLREEVESQMMCAELEFTDEGVLVLYAAENKHALYPTAQICEDALLVEPAYKEDCGWDAGNDATGGSTGFEWRRTDLEADDRYLGTGRWRFDCINAGNERVHLVDDLDEWKTWLGLTPGQYVALAIDEAMPSEAVWSGHHNGGSFCGGLERTCVKVPVPAGIPGQVMWAEVCDEPEGCSTMIGYKISELPELLRMRLQSNYRVAIETGGLPGAGTDANVTITLYNADGEYVTIQAQAGPYPYSRSDFQGARLEALDRDVLYDLLFAHVPHRYLGDIDHVVVEHDNTGHRPGWYVERIVVEDIQEGTTTAFAVAQWLEREGDRPARLDLYPQEE